MKTAYDASDPLEAHMIVDLLARAGIAAQIEGENVSRGFGQALSVRVRVADSAFDDAREVIDEWRQSQTVTEQPVPRPKHSTAAAALIGFIVGVGLSALYYRTPVTEEGIDYDRDGQLDIQWTYTNGLLSRSEQDRNFDGKIDWVDRFDRKSVWLGGESDENFDGVFETEFKAENGTRIWSRSDTTGDGFKDYRVTFEHGVVREIAFVDPVLRSPVKILRFDGIKAVSAELDTDRDGIIDTVHVYDGIEEIRSSKSR